MHAGRIILIPVLLLLASGNGFAQSLEEYVAKAQGLHNSGDIAGAAAVMDEAIARFPENSTACSYMGFYRGIQAGQTQNYLEAGKLVNTAFAMLNKAVTLDPENPIAHFHRGIIFLNVPPFFNTKQKGIDDLELLIRLSQNAAGRIPLEMTTASLELLAETYEKNGETEKSLAALERVIEVAPGTASAENAHSRIAGLKSQSEAGDSSKTAPAGHDARETGRAAEAKPGDAGGLIEQARAYYAQKKIEEAEKILRKAVQLDSGNVEGYTLLIEVLGELAGRGYDEKIYEDTNYRTNLAFDVVNLADKAVALAPDDMKLRLMRGSIGVMMPFFVGRLEAAMDDLNRVKNSSAPREMKAEAIFWLGYAHQKMAFSNWIEIITDYSKTAALKLAFETMYPPVKHLDIREYKKPCLSIDFVLGFRDELPPQTAVWIEDTKGTFVKNIYVSGFSAFAKEKQANLGEWASISKFKDVQAVTGASIDIGQHIFVWDLLNSEMKRVDPGDYVVKIEVAFWPSMEYQLVSAPVSIGKETAKSVRREGNLIPYLEVNYFPQDQFK